MFKFIIVLIVSLNVALPVSASQCTDELFETLELKFDDGNQLQCLVEHIDFIAATKGLCAEDQYALSDNYRSYLSFEVLYFHTASDLVKESDPSKKSQLIYMLQVIERDWLLFGFRLEITELLSLLDQAKSDCSFD